MAGGAVGDSVEFDKPNAARASTGWGAGRIGSGTPRFAESSAGNWSSECGADTGLAVTGALTFLGLRGPAGSTLGAVGTTFEGEVAPNRVASRGPDRS